MFETAELHRKVSKEDYDAREPGLRTALLALQERLREEARFPVILLIAGVDGAGKGETVNLLHEWMDPRWLQTHAFGDPTDEERERPAFWRFWRTLPAKGRVGIFFGSWYTDPILDRVRGRIGGKELERQLTRINGFERALVDDGALIIKLWFHLGKEAQRARLKELRQDKRTRWRVTDVEVKNLRRYDRFLEVDQRVLRETSTGGAPWLIVEGEDKRYRSLAVGQHLLEAMTRRLEAGKPPATPAPALPVVVDDGRTILSALRQEGVVGEEEYEERLEELQGRVNRVWRRAAAKRRSCILVFEGSDAAGKGGAIRRITPALDARGYRIIPTAAPTEEERAQHYLWRFWRHLPRRGRMTIFDRSWYGRVLVERVEGFATEEEWMRGYSEINEFEEQLHEHGIVIVKFWLHIDPKEQLRRFKERERTSYKQHKITAEDYRNREKGGQYERAVDDMVTRTSTEFAPWHLVPANDKRAARLQVLETVGDQLEAALRR